MNIIMKRVDTLVPYERNAKKHDQKQVDNVAKSLEKFGWKQPLVVSDDGVVVVGHCRLLAAKQLGMEEAPCVVASDLTEEEIREYRIMDNKTNESPWERDVLALEIGELDFEGFDLDFPEEPEKDDEPAEETNAYDDEAFEPEPFDDEILNEYKDHETEFLAKKRVIITYAPERELQLCQLLNIDPDKLKIVYDLSELVDE